MATAEQIKLLIQSRFSKDAESFYTVALQVAAHEARKGHIEFANDIKDIIDKEKGKRSKQIIQFPKSLQGLVLSEESSTPLTAMVTPMSIQKRLTRIIHEYRQQQKLKSYGLQHRRKILLIGPPGTGKTMSAKVLARELDLQLNTIQVDRLVTKFMGETSAKLRQIFELIEEEHGVYLFDEFDAIGGDRSLDNEVGEMRRVLNAFLQFIEQDKSDSLIIAATNNPQILDRALFRRFDDVLYYQNPQEADRKQLIANVLGTFLAKRFQWKKVINASDNLSYAEITSACQDAIKNAILDDANSVSASQILITLKEKQATHPHIQ